MTLEEISDKLRNLKWLLRNANVTDAEWNIDVSFDGELMECQIAKKSNVTVDFIVNDSPESFIVEGNHWNGSHAVNMLRDKMYPQEE